MRILVTNDDGIYSPGIAALAKVATEFGEVYVVAPDVEQSSMGHAVTHSRPLSFKNHPLRLGITYRPTGSTARPPTA
ncbi:5'/3'-nucleotidase SurE [Siphonobacter sp. BAB-5385]|uniref:5'/3'-nucleotidase SurE n=1 Tax=Siphonobacter sp. BAB-5385 TaxID=1864822 RepID=UPI0020CE3FCE|nr:5'/3'-nucleotidase SurE [Siphonobacter sp. BAB-5385]